MCFWITFSSLNVKSKLQGNWKSADDHPDIVTKLVQEEVAAGFVNQFTGSLEQARKAWPQGIAVGKLGVQMSEGHDPRLTLDTTVDGVNPGVVIREKPQNPTPKDVALSFEPLTQLTQDRDNTDYIAFTADVSKAHKRIRLHPEEQGLLLFQWMGILYHYKVCHFGGRFSGYWWARMGAYLHRMLHRIIFISHAGWLYVDDWLWRFRTDIAPIGAMLTCMSLVAVGCPLSWHKLAYGRAVKWIGLIHNFSERTFTIPEDKTARALEFLQQVGQSDNTFDRHQLQSGTGLLMWLSMLLHLLRPWLSEFYAALNRPVSNLVNCSIQQLAEVVDRLSHDLTLKHQCTLSTAGKGWKLREINHRPITNIDEAKASTVRGLGRVWVRLDNPGSTKVRVNDELRISAKIWHAALAQGPKIIPMLGYAYDTHAAAADAFANDTKSGIGGWLDSGKGQSASAVHWFQLLLTPDMFPNSWGMSDNPQRDITFYELLAQVALLYCRRLLGGNKPLQITVCQLTDNLPGAAVGDKLFTTATPLKYAAQLLAAHATMGEVHVDIQHIAGVDNILADKLSRDERPQARVSMKWHITPGHKIISQM